MSNQEIQKVKDFTSKCIDTLEKGNYAYICNGYIGGNDGDKYDSLIQRHSNKIISKLVSLGYIYTTNHGFGCYDWSFSKDFEI